MKVRVLNVSLGQTGGAKAYGARKSRAGSLGAKLHRRALTPKWVGQHP